MNKEKSICYKDIEEHIFVVTILQSSAKILENIREVDSIIAVKTIYKRAPTIPENYCLHVGSSLAHILTTCQQLEHSIFFLSTFSKSKKIKENNITAAHYLLYIMVVSSDFGFLCKSLL